MSFQATYSVYGLDLRNTYNKLRQSKDVTGGLDITKGTVPFWLNINSEKVKVQITRRGCVNIWHREQAYIHRAVEKLKPLAVNAEGEICKVWLPTNLQKIGSTRIASGPTEEGVSPKNAHDKLIVDKTRAAWREKLSNPHKILEIERDGESLKVDFSPFVENPHISYFESHLETGYPLFWNKIRRWKGSYSKLVERTTELAERTRLHVEQLEILPRYDRLRSSNGHVHYEQFLCFYFHAVSLELEGFIQFEVKIGESMHGEVKWYSLQMAQQGQFADSPSKNKILHLKRRIEEFHSDQNIYREFAEVFREGEGLNSQLADILVELEEVWAEVENNVPLKGWCKAGVKGKYEFGDVSTPKRCDGADS